MKRALFLVAPLVLFCTLPLGYGQSASMAATASDTNEFLTVNLPTERQIEIDLKATPHLPGAHGKAEVKNEKGMTRIEAKLDDMKPAVLFGGDFNTYVLWLITPEGQVQNLGEFILDGDNARLKATTPLSNFGLFITAEPHFLVDYPSRMVVLLMEKPGDNRLTDFRTAQLRYEGVKGMYDFTRDTLANAPEIKSDHIDFDVAQARTAVRLAERSGATQFAAVELQAARQALQRAEEVARTEKKVDNRVSPSREAVRLAVRAQNLSQEQAVRLRQQTEQQQQISQAEERGRQQGYNEASRAFEQAQESARTAQQHYQELSQEQQRREQLVLDAERTLREAEQNQQALQNQQPTSGQQRTEQVEQAKAQLEQVRQEAEQAKLQALQAEQESQQAKRLAAQRQQELQSERQAHQQTEQQLNRLQSEQAQTRQQLRNALGQIAETRETQEGLVVSLPDILFEFDSAALKPEAREVLKKVAQTLGSAGKYKLTIDGYTDSVGRPEYNRELSQARARTVRDFLVQSGMDRSLIVEVRGLGETHPRASNDSAQGRQENRRVEILVQEPNAPARAE